jgi:hypothetical protein
VHAARIGQRAARDLSTKPCVVQFRTNGPQARLDIAQTFAKRELSKSQAKELIATGESSQATIALVAVDAAVELASRQKIHQLRKHELSFEHKTSLATSARKTCPCEGSNVADGSSRVQASCVATDYRFKGYSESFVR